MGFLIIASLGILDLATCFQLDVTYDWFIYVSSVKCQPFYFHLLGYPITLFSHSVISDTPLNMLKKNSANDK